MSDAEKLDELAKRRGFFFQSSKAYGGVSGFYTFGPEGAEVKKKVENEWRRKFSQKEGNREIEAPTIMPEPVFEASGHLDGFDDMILKCPSCGKETRADHLVEDNTDIEEAEGFSTQKIAEIITENQLQCPSCGAEFEDPEVEDFNLMFQTDIGPGDSSPGYLRPETAQGIFVEFPRLKEYARGQLPFGITQIGKAYRNEISPRNALVRVREFTQAELELFIDPEEDEPELEKVEDVELKLYPVEEQGGGEYRNLTVKEAVEQEVIESDWVAYYLGLAKPWFEKVGIDMERFRFRQHNEGERAHYATDCWDAEAEIDGDWIELAGFAYRGCYDLTKHDEHSQDDFSIFKRFDEPKEIEEKTVSPDMGYLGPEYGDAAGEIVDRLEDLVDENPERFESDKIEVKIEDQSFEIPVEKTGFKAEKVEKNGEHIVPHVVEPSFGIGRVFYTILAHSLEKDEIDGEERDVMRIPYQVAPTEIAVMPMMDKDGMGEKAQEISEELREEGFSVSYDSNGSVGKRYRRQDEVGTPVCVTVDYETLEDGTVTLRDRDSTEQVRAHSAEIVDEVKDFVEEQDL